MALSMIFGGFGGYAMIMIGKHIVPEWFAVAMFSKSDAMGLLIAFPVMYVLTIAIHELGHLAGALASGFKFRVLTIGPFSLISTAHGLQFRMAWSVVTMIGGQQISAPPPGGGTARQYLVYLAGGGVANAVAGLALVGVASAGALPPMWIGILLMGAALNLFLGPLNLLPLSMRNGIRTDGYNMRTLLRGGARAARFRAVFELIGHSFAGTRPRDWRDDILSELLMGEPNGLETVLAHLMVLQVALDRADVNTVRVACEKIVAQYSDVPAALRGQFATELVTAYALFLDDTESAARFDADVNAKSYLISPATILRSRAALAYAKGQHEESRAAIAQGRKVLHRSTMELDHVMETHWFDLIEKRIANQSMVQAKP